MTQLGEPSHLLNQPVDSTRDWITITFIDGFERFVRNTPITFGSSGGLALKTDNTGKIRYKPGEIQSSTIFIGYKNPTSGAQWPVQLPTQAGEYTIRLSIWGTSHHSNQPRAAT